MHDRFIYFSKDLWSECTSFLSWFFTGLIFNSTCISKLKPDFTKNSTWPDKARQTPYVHVSNWLKPSFDLYGSLPSMFAWWIAGSCMLRCPCIYVYLVYHAWQPLPIIILLVSTWRWKSLVLYNVENTYKGLNGKYLSVLDTVKLLIYPLGGMVHMHIILWNHTSCTMAWYSISEYPWQVLV